MNAVQQAYYKSESTLTGSGTFKVMPDINFVVRRDVMIVGFDLCGRAMNTYNNEDFPYILYLVNSGFQTNSTWVVDQRVPSFTCQSNGAVSFYNARGYVSPGTSPFEVVAYTNKTIPYDVDLYFYFSIFYNVT